MKAEAQYFAPDGFFPKGNARHWREIRIESIKDGLAQFRYVDTGGVGNCSTRNLKFRAVQAVPNGEEACGMIAAC
jgi:hypothetical protein